MAAAEAAVRQRLLALGYSEAISSSFASEADAATFAPLQTHPTPGTHATNVALENPLSEEARLLRAALVPGMVAMLAHNLNRDVREARLFEAGAIFSSFPDSGAVAERESLALGLTGDLPATPLHSAKDAPIFELKGVIQSLLSLFAPAAPSGALNLQSPTAPSSDPGTPLTFTPEAPAWLEPGRSATALLAGTPIASFGELASPLREARKLRQPVYLAQIDLAALYALPLRRATARELSRFQAVERDFSFTFGDTVTWQTVAQAIQTLAIPELIRLAPAEVFRDPKGSSIPLGHYALLTRCVFQSPDRTLREDELTTWSAAIITTLTALGGAIRT
jgi:phenylalanyl-tRNA synthetase beta chain